MLCLVGEDSVDALARQADAYRKAWAEAMLASAQSVGVAGGWEDTGVLGGLPPDDRLSPTSRRILDNAWQRFLDGYHAGGGDGALDQAWIATLSCEGSQWEGYYGQNGYWTRAQFSLDTWLKVTDHFAYWDADDPRFVGEAVAWWASLTVASEQWPVCGREAGLP